MSVPSCATDYSGALEVAIDCPEVPFLKHWLYYIAIKLLVLGGVLALALRLFEVW